MVHLSDYINYNRGRRRGGIVVSALDPKGVAEFEPRPNEGIVFTLTVPAIFMLGVTSDKPASYLGGLLLVTQFYRH